MKVVVIDDKPLIRRAIVETMDWVALSCEVVASSEDGLSGKLIIEQHEPDIIITDIRMPGMDGLELAEYAGTILEHFKVIVITGYEDFNFAKTCLRLGVTEYLLKPLNNGELCDAVKRVSTQLLQERQVRLEREHMLPMVKGQRISDILIGRIPSGELKKLMNKEQRKAIRFGVLLIRDILVPAWELNTTSSSVNMMSNRFLQAVDQELNEEATEFYKIHMVNELVIVMIFHDSVSDRYIKQVMAEWANRLKNVMTLEEQHRFLLDYSPPFKSLSQLREQYLELSRKLTMMFFHSSENSSTEKVKMSIFFDLEEFDKALSNTSADVLASQVQTLLYRISIYAAGNIIVAKALISELCLTIVRHHYNYSNSEKVLGKTVDALLEHVNRLPDMDHVGEYIVELIIELKEIQESEKTSFSVLVKNILNYINENYHKELSLNVVAEQFQVSSGHISRLLRKETQSNFVDIVSRTRIEVAKKLMRDPIKRIQEISEMTGFKNYMYFYQVFKKYENISPQEYKNNIKL